MHGRTDKFGDSRSKRRKVIKDEMLSEDERKQSEDDSLLPLKLRQKLLEQRKPIWEALFEKYESKTEEVSSDDCISLTNESLRSKDWEYKSERPAIKLKNWHEEFIPSSVSSKDSSEQQQPVEVDEGSKKNEDIGTVENSVINVSPAQKSKSVLRRASKSGKKGKKMSVNDDISQNIYQLRSRKKKEDNVEKAADASQGVISKDIIKKRQKRTFKNRTHQKTNYVEELHHHESSRVNDTCNKHDNTPCLDTEVHFEKQTPVKKDLINSTVLSDHVPEEMKKNYYKGGLKLRNAKNLGNISQNLPSTKLDIAHKENKQNCEIEKEKHENTAHHAQYSFLNFSIDLMKTESEGQEDFSFQSKKKFEKQGQKNVKNSKTVVFPEETVRELSEWRTEFSNFIKYRWIDFQNNPGSLLFPLPKLKPSDRDEKLSWESIMNAN